MHYFFFSGSLKKLLTIRHEISVAQAQIGPAKDLGATPPSKPQECNHPQNLIYNLGLYALKVGVSGRVVVEIDQVQIVCKY